MAEITTATIRLLNSLHQGTPLHKEAACGSVDTVRGLVNRGADVNVQDKMGVCEQGYYRLYFSSAVLSWSTVLTGYWQDTRS